MPDTTSGTLLHTDKVVCRRKRNHPQNNHTPPRQLSNSDTIDSPRQERTPPMAQPTIQWNIVECPESLQNVDIQRIINTLHFNRLIDCSYDYPTQTHASVDIEYKYKGEKETISPYRNGQRFDYANVNSNFKIFLSAQTGWGSMMTEEQFRYIWQEIMLDYNRNTSDYPVEPFDY